jgi:hypothetical protein
MSIAKNKQLSRINSFRKLCRYDIIDNNLLKLLAKLRNYSQTNKQKVKKTTFFNNNGGFCG